MIINLISSPRNISTALMYSFANRGDIKVIDEPYYAYYLNLTGIVHPGQDEIIESQPLNHSHVTSAILEQEEKYGNVFVKNMAHHMIGFDLNEFRTFCNIFLIRDPKEIIASYSKVIPHPSMEDIGCERQVELYQQLSDYNSIVVDSNEILRNPERMLKLICEKFNLKYTDKMVNWERGQIPEDGVWSKYWYKAVHDSTGFLEYKEKRIELSEENMELYLNALPSFTSLKKNELK